MNEALKWIDMVIGWNARDQMDKEAVHVALCTAKERISKLDTELEVLRFAQTRRDQEVRETRIKEEKQI